MEIKIEVRNGDLLKYEVVIGGRTLDFLPNVNEPHKQDIMEVVRWCITCGRETETDLAKTGGLLKI